MALIGADALKPSGLCAKCEDADTEPCKYQAKYTAPRPSKSMRYCVDFRPVKRKRSRRASHARR